MPRWLRILNFHISLWNNGTKNSFDRFLRNKVNPHRYSSFFLNHEDKWGKGCFLIVFSKKVENQLKQSAVFIQQHDSECWSHSSHLNLHCVNTGLVQASWHRCDSRSPTASRTFHRGFDGSTRGWDACVVRQALWLVGRRGREPQKHRQICCFFFFGNVWGP